LLVNLYHIREIVWNTITTHILQILSALVTLILQEALLKKMSHLNYDSIANKSQSISSLKESETHNNNNNNSRILIKELGSVMDFSNGKHENQTVMLKY